MAAVLAGGVRTFLSYWSSAEALGMIRLGTRRPIHLSSSVRAGGAPRGVIVHRPRRLERKDVTRWRGIPTTTAARTLLDLAAVESPKTLRRAFEQAEYKEILDRSRLAELCERTDGRRGGAAVRGLIAAPHLPLERTRGGPERNFLEICHDFTIRTPEVNVPLFEYEVDFLWEPERFVVEIDGGHHERPEQRDRDHAKDARLGRAGYLIRRFRPAVLKRAAPVAAEVIETLAARAPGST